jgi:hypothetical protein
VFLSRGLFRYYIIHVYEFTRSHLYLVLVSWPACPPSPCKAARYSIFKRDALSLQLVLPTFQACLSSQAPRPSAAHPLRNSPAHHMARSQFRASVTSLMTAPGKLAAFPGIRPAPSARNNNSDHFQGRTCGVPQKTTTHPGSHKINVTLLRVCPEKNPFPIIRGPFVCRGRA